MKQENSVTLKHVQDKHNFSRKNNKRNLKIRNLKVNRFNSTSIFSEMPKIITTEHFKTFQLQLPFIIVEELMHLSKLAEGDNSLTFNRDKIIMNK